MMAFGFTSDWLRKLCEFPKPITSNAKPKQIQITFDTQVKTIIKGEYIIRSSQLIQYKKCTKTSKENFNDDIRILVNIIIHRSGGE